MEATKVINPAATSAAISTTAQKPSPWGTPASPWATNTATPCSLHDVMGEEMSEQLAKKLQHDEEEKLFKSAGTGNEVDFSSFLPEQTEDTDNDQLLAQMLQDQFNREFDEQLRREENKFNGTSKVRVSFDNYKHGHDTNSGNVSAEEEEEEDDSIPKFKKGYIGKGKNIITKHDENLSYKKNSKKVMEFPPEFDTGDAKEYRLPNHVYNQLKVHSLSDSKRKMRLHDKKEHSTAVMAVDEKTRLLLYKLMNSQVLENINGVICTGKESVIMHAQGGTMDTGLVPEECAIKVFKTTLNEFKNRAIYIKGDIRFMKDDYRKQNPRKIIKIWAEKEDRNLKRLEKCGIPCPKVVILKKHCLVMSFIGKDGRAAPQLKHARLDAAGIMDAYDQCIENMKKMFRVAGLVHGDLSEYNLLWHDGKLYFIDVSQSVERFHPSAMQFLLRDCFNVCEFFSKSGVPNVPTHYELFNEITGLTLQGEGEEFLAQVEDYEKNEEKLRMEKGKDYPFEYFFSQAQKEHNSQLQGEDRKQKEEELHAKGEEPGPHGEGLSKKGEELSSEDEETSDDNSSDSDYSEEEDPGDNKAI